MTATDDPRTPVAYRVRCEDGVQLPGRTVYCDRDVTHQAHRVDGRKDYFYICGEHARTWGERTSAIWEVSPIYGRILPARVVLGLFPPRHRFVTKQDALAVLSA